MGLSDLWYKTAFVYAVDVKTYLDSNADGVGDFRGLTSRLDYLHSLGVNCLWLLPFYVSPDRDNGYDVADHLSIDPRVGNGGDFAEFVQEAHGRGIRILIDFVANHTSDEHAWFQRARRDPRAPEREFYVWADTPPADAPKPVFPGQTRSVWTKDPWAGCYYFHHFYDFEPGLNLDSGPLREELRRIAGYWLALGVDGFRIDAAPFLIHPKGPGGLRDRDQTFLKNLFRFATRRAANPVLLGEANVPPDQLAAFFGDGDEIQLLFNFIGASHVFLALARGDAGPLRRAFELAVRKPAVGQWAAFLRNLDELDLSRLGEEEQEEVLRAFAPDEQMRLTGKRGIRRRLAPMLGGDPQRLRLAFNLLFTLPGAPAIAYGDEIGMGDDLRLDGRDAVRTPMQWSAEANGGFSGADDGLVRPVVSDGPFGYRRVNVAGQVTDRESLWHFVAHLASVRRQHPEFGIGSWTVLQTGVDAVFGVQYDSGGETSIVLSNLSSRPCTATPRLGPDSVRAWRPLLADHPYPPPEPSDPLRIELGPFGFRWFHRPNPAGRVAPPPVGEL